MRRLLVFVFAFSVLAMGSAYAQTEATINGTVVDDSGGVLPGVTVTATEINTGRQFFSITDERGEYRMPSVEPGTYSVTAELPGFGTVEVPALELLVGQNAAIPFTLGVAGLEESVTVTSEAPLIDITSNEVSGNVDRRQMEELPISGRNWMELSMLVKGITANDTNNNRPGEAQDERFQLNLDGQQVTQRVASSFFGQPKFSREAIAEFQIVTNLFDITQGRSSGIQVQAITRSGTNQTHGGFYGFFRDDSWNAADHVAGEVLPFENQQIGGTIGGPIRQDKLLYFVSYERERQPSTIFATPGNLPSQSFLVESKTDQNSLTARVDAVLSDRDHLSVRGAYWDFETPIDMTSGQHITEARARTQDSTNLLGTWSRVINDDMVQELKVGYNGFEWTNRLAFADQISGCSQAFGNTGTFATGCQPNYVFPGLTIGGPRNFPQLFTQDLFSARYDLNMHKGSHDFKIGGEFLGWKDGGEWHLLERGEFIFNTRPADIEARFPEAGALDPSTWDVSGLDATVNRFNQNAGNWEIDIPRPTWAIWFGDTWRLSDRLTINYGVRWDVDWGATAPPHVTTQATFNPIDGGAYGNNVAINAGDQLFRSDIRDTNNVAPRFGFNWAVDEDNTLVIRGGSGLFYTVSSSNVTFSQQSFNGQRILVNSYPNDGLPGFLQDPTRGVSAADVVSGVAPVPPQAPRVIAHDYIMPYTWQSSIGFQKQLTDVIGVEADVVYWKEHNSPRARDLNLSFNPATGYNLPTSQRPDANYTQVRWIEPHGKADYAALSTGLTRRFRDNFQFGATWTLMFFKNNNTTSWGYFPNNPFDPDADWAIANDFQRNTIRLNGIYRLPYDISIAASYFFGSGNMFPARVSGSPYGKPASQNRLNIGAPITVNPAFADRFDGPAVIGTNTEVPRNALQGLALHKMDLRLSKVFNLGNVRITGIAEVFNLLNHENFGGYQAFVNRSNFGNPVQNAGTAYVPRSGQFAFRIDF